MPARTPAATVGRSTLRTDEGQPALRSVAWLLPTVAAMAVAVPLTAQARPEVGGGPASDARPACTPTTTALQFDGGYKVSMCYRTTARRRGPGQVRHLGFGPGGTALVLPTRQRRGTRQGPGWLRDQRPPLGLRGAGHRPGVQPLGHRSERQTLDPRQQPARTDLNRQRQPGIQLRGRRQWRRRRWRRWRWRRILSARPSRAVRIGQQRSPQRGPETHAPGHRDQPGRRAVRHDDAALLPLLRLDDHHLGHPSRKRIHRGSFRVDVDDRVDQPDRTLAPGHLLLRRLRGLRVGRIGDEQQLLEWVPRSRCAGGAPRASSPVGVRRRHSPEGPGGASRGVGAESHLLSSTTSTFWQRTSLFWLGRTTRPSRPCTKKRLEQTSPLTIPGTPPTLLAG